MRRLLILTAALGLLIGVVIGALGGGGGVLTVPVLVFVLDQTAQNATTSSIIIVGITAAVGVLARLRGGLLQWRTGLVFGAVGIPAAALGSLLTEHVPQPVLLLSFAALTVLVAVAMILDSLSRPVLADDAAAQPEAVARPDGVDTPSRPHLPMRAGGAVGLEAPPNVRASSSGLATTAKVVACGLVIGFVTGFLGVGGGFLIVPVLVMVLRMPMPAAIGTSLLIIAINSTAALVTRAGVAEFDWAILVPFTLAAIAGGLAGKRISDRLSGATLSRGFAVLLLAVGGYVAVRSFMAL